MKRVATGIQGLDEVLFGGLPELSNILIGGAPGTGKTILCQNILFNINKATERNVVYFSTVAESQLKILRYQQQFSFFDTNTFMESVIFQDLGDLIKGKGIEEGISAIKEVILKYSPLVIAIDSFKAIADLMPSEESFRRFITELSTHLSIWECTALLIGEYQEDELKKRQEAAVVDGIIYLYGTEEQKHQRRYLRILKLRGSNQVPGEHIFQISAQGVGVFPRTMPGVDKRIGAYDGRRLSTGIPGLDEMLGGGLPAGTTTLVSGSTGTGKSLMGLSWLLEGAARHELGMLVTFEQFPEQVINNSLSFGYEAEAVLRQGLLEVMHVPPVELDVDHHFFKIQQLVVEKKVKRLVMDSISAFEVGMPDKYKFTDYLWGITNFFKTQGVSLMLVNETPGLFHTHHLSKHGISYIADNIIVLQLIQDNFQLCRHIGIIKVRGSRCSPQVKEIVLGGKGLLVTELKKNGYPGLRQQAINYV